MSYFQDLIEGNHCFGCGPFNAGGLGIKSCWKNDAESACVFTPAPHHCAAPTKFMNGGIIATVIDCHCICTAIAHGYRRDNRAIGEGEAIWYATSKLTVEYRRPVPIAEQMVLTAKVVAETDRKMDIACIVESGGKECATALVVASIVPPAWMA